MSVTTSSSLKFAWLIATILVVTLGFGSSFAPQAVAQAAETVLHEFAGGTDGYSPYGPLAIDAAGNLYAEVAIGGENGNGYILELTPVSGGGWKGTDIFDFLGDNGVYPTGGLTIDSQGNLYGSTLFGGHASCGCGVVFELSPNAVGGWAYTLLYSFDGNGMGPNGIPQNPVVLDTEGNVYSTSQTGGNQACRNGCGYVFKLTRSSGWQRSIVWAFTGGTGGQQPGAVTFDRAGNLYGVAGGGKIGSQCPTGCSFVFELSPASDGGWKETTLYDFDFKHGAGLGLLTLAPSGHFYGTTVSGGTANACDADGSDGCGVVFELSPGSSGWKESVLHAFTGGTDGGVPWAGVTLDAAGNLFGATGSGGDSSCSINGGSGCGVVFELTHSASGWQETVLHSFTDHADGTGPTTDLILDSAGNLYAASPAGGVTLNSCPYGCGLIFELTPHDNPQRWKANSSANQAISVRAY